MEGDEFRNLTFMIIRTTPDLRGAFRNLADELSQRDRYHPMVIDALAAWIVWILLRTAGRDGKKDETGPASRVATAKEMIDREFDRPRLTLDEISQRVLLKKDSLRHLFKKRYGTSPIQYLIAKKIGRAKFLLAGSGEKIYRIAMETGFENEYYFSRIFKKATGLTPTQYRRRCRV
jgi:AraC-like DNA-binding protein